MTLIDDNDALALIQTELLKVRAESAALKLRIKNGEMVEAAALERAVDLAPVETAPKKRL
jgi:hypothetical protein